MNYINDLEEQIQVDVQISDPSELAEQVRLGSCVGLSLLLRKIMSVLSDMLDPNSGLHKQKQKIQGGKSHGRQAMESMRFSLFLVNIALEAGGPALSSMPSLVETLRNDMCRHLLRASQAENLTILSLALRVVFNLFMSIKEHMKVQLEVFLTSVHLRLLNKPSGAVFTTHNHISPKEELALESLLEFCREPSLMIDLYTNYDCDVQCTNLFDSIVNTLCIRSLPRGVPHSLLSDSGSNTGQRDSNVVVSNSSANSSTNGVTINVDILNKLAFDGLLTILRTVANKFSSQERKSSARNSPMDLRSSSGIEDEGNEERLASVKKVLAVDLPLPPPPPHQQQQQPQRPVLVSPIPLILPQRSHVRIHYGAQRKQPSHQTTIDENHLLKLGSTALDNATTDTKSVNSAVVVPLSENTVDHQVDLWCESADPDYLDQEFDSTEAETEDFEDDSQSNRSNQGQSEKSLSLNIPKQEFQEFPMIFSVNKKQSKSSSSKVPFSPAQISKELRRTMVNNSNGSISNLNDQKVPVVTTTKESAVTLLRQRKIMKQKLKLAAERFNAKPLKVDWVKYALKIGILEPKKSENNQTADVLPSTDDATSVQEKKPVTNPEELLTDAKSVALFCKSFQIMFLVEY